MNVDQIEYRVEKMTDRADHAYMNNAMSTEEYEAEMKRINDWADSQYALIQ